ncbi:MAG: Ig-like domain-containing protein [Prevotellaceae bacterium]|nr:Ig-like domain-containing protein [Prevotellaceae bacterium]
MPKVVGGIPLPVSKNEADAEAIRYFIEQADRDHEGNPRPNTPMVGGIAIFSAGNAGDNSLFYPAAADNVIAVASVGVSGKKPAYSNFGAWVNISAHGGDAINGQPTIYGTTTNNSYGYNHGTSFACPHVSRVAALILSKYGHSGYTPDSLRVRLEATTTPLFDLEPNFAQFMGSGLLNAANALQPFVPVTSITLPSTIELKIGEIYTPKGFILPDNATDQRIKWSGANPDIVPVDLRGRLMGLQKGTTTIKASSYDEKYATTCTVIVRPTAVSELHLTPDELNLSVGETYQLEAVVIPNNAANPTISKNGSNGSIVSVDDTGFITAPKEGVATITAKSVAGDITDKCIVTVTPIVSGISISPKKITLTIGEQEAIHAEITPKNAARSEILWKSSDPNHVVVDENGVVTAVKAGRYGEPISVRITATTLLGSFTDDAMITIQPEMVIPESFSPNGDGINDYFKISSMEGDTYTLRIMDRSEQPCYESF